MQKLDSALGKLSKVRHYVAKTKLKNLYYALFEFHLQKDKVYNVSQDILFIGS